MNSLPLNFCGPLHRSHYVSHVYDETFSDYQPSQFGTQVRFTDVLFLLEMME